MALAYLRWLDTDEGQRAPPAEAQRRAAIVFGRWLTLVRGLVGSQKIGDRHVPFGPSDETVVKAALRTLTGLTLRPVLAPMPSRFLSSRWMAWLQKEENRSSGSSANCAPGSPSAVDG